MESISIKNLRSIKDTGDIKIKPLTILLGKNSSGKSSFLRFFPLMKQTILSKRREALLWYSPDSVDFGSFETAINRVADPKILELGFKFKLANEDFYQFSQYFRRRSIFYENNTIDSGINFELAVIIKENNFKNIQFNISEDIKIELRFSQGKMGIFVKPFDYSYPKIDVETYHERSAFLPEIVLAGNGSIDADYFINEIYKKLYRDYLLKKVPFEEDLLEGEDKEEKLRRDFERHFSDFLSLFKVSDYKKIIENEKDFLNNFITSKINYYNEEYAYKTEKLSDQFKLFVKFISTINDKEDRNELYSLMLLSNLTNILNLINKKISQYFLNVQYLAPLRANVQRYYRESGISIDEIDTQGVNMPMILKDLTDQQRKRFEKWVWENFGFIIGTENIQDHLYMYISFSSDREAEKINLADVGFGFSQILPIIYTLWSKTERRINRSHNSIYSRPMKKEVHILIEQPELHLHPAMQAKLVDAFINSINYLKKARVNISIILETHSDIIVNRVGRMILEKNFDSNNCNILIFSDDDINHSIIKSISYDEKGIIHEWPIGFFQPDEDLSQINDEFDWEEDE
ncbi:AAA family ATPase [Lysinibacillus sp. LK3]|uniref:AAA family ATPase n=1 Tax=Lysinibacillus sp. LK3 TaxID=1628207 RepID=UPI000654109F|nr:AAA family ATPase [Lysinibacillus sp. LK3]KMN41974.1 hypothetical protein VK91_02560 [Lysinibacillus sp. LK3]